MSDPTPRDAAGTPAADDAPVLHDAAEPVDATARADEPAGVVPTPGSHPVLRYTLARLGILAAVAAVLYVLGARGLLLLVFAFLISGLIAMVALNRTREGAAYGITSAIRNANAKIDASTRAEDDALDAAAADPIDPAAAALPRTTPQHVAEPEPADAEPIDDWDDPAPR